VNIKELGWNLAYNRRVVIPSLLRSFHCLPLELSEWYPDCLKYYSDLNVRGKVVLDVGCDFGTSPLYFIRRGAKLVIGVSLEPQYFRDNHYLHYHIPDKDERDAIMDTLVRWSILCDVLKVDAEGLEWEMWPAFIMQFEDWIISLHTPIRNPPLYEWIKEHGELMGTEATEEFATYRKSRA
jgi:SAM-dependent methyltransferase